MRSFLFIVLVLRSSFLYTQSDDCPGAQLLGVYSDCRTIPSATFWLNKYATKNSCEGNTDDDGWFRFIAISPRTRVVVFSDQLANMAISVFEDCRTELACVNERGMGGQEVLVLDTKIGEEYFVQIYDFGVGGGGFLICLAPLDAILTSDCAGAVVICEDGDIPFTPIGAGKDDFATDANRAGCLSKKENQSAWYYFEIEENAPANIELTFQILPEASIDYDFALFGPNVVCDALGAPIRCSFADSTCDFCPMTGLGMGATDAAEGSEGDGFLAPLLVQPREGYYLLVETESKQATSFMLKWGGRAAPFLNCTAPLPCGLAIDAGNSIRVCEATQLQIDSKVIGNTDNIQYQWRGSAGTISYLDNPFVSDPILTLPTAFEGQIGYELTAIARGCKVVDSLFINKSCETVNCPPITATLTLNLPDCKDANSGAIQIGQIEGGMPPYSFKLANSTTFQTATTFQNLGIGEYSIIIQDKNGCQLDTFIELITPILPTLDIGSDIIAEQGKVIRLKANSNFPAKQINKVSWSNVLAKDCPLPCLDIQFTALLSGIIEATLETTENCLVSAAIQISVIPKLDFYLPSAFSPNGDGINDGFTVFAGAGIAQINTLRIFDRWGNLVFQRANFLPNDANLGWKGTFKEQNLASGVFIYYANIALVDGQTITKAGDVFLVR